MTRPTHPLIIPTALSTILDSVTVIDTRWKLGEPLRRHAYDEGHLPGAAWVEFEGVMAAEPGTGGRHPMPDRDVFTAAMRAAGVDNDRPVVVYDDDDSLAASRCWWLLKYFGKEDVQVLDGGFAAWQAAGLPVSTDEPAPPEGDFYPTDPGAALLDADGAADFAAGKLLLDARPADRFAGRNETVDPVAGHIPAAVSSPSLANVTEAGPFLPPDDLAMRFTGLGIRTDSEVGIYCGSGVQATHLALALEASGIRPRTSIYIGSWSHWITDPERPVEK
ncbi:sulfurtransferase [Flexivirga endophytica]|uniref:Sulfurtransferase n=1 Tax=Flexivirga endophytica TaxID=1849103 RepID=A0A916WY17_9MICO|nr:sulfurtransferase [Flexivirga endophytica]GGB41309.1 sulfurtransferase [Flexivirga endophytica]GHB49153.1 sulfurtransferase [Flexivirga endophytica]